VSFLIRTCVAGALAGSLAFAVLELSGFDVAALAQGTASGDYVISVGADSIVSGSGDIGNHCDDCVTPLFLPFAYTLYNQPYTVTYVSSNGNLQFGSSNAAFSNTSLPRSDFNFAIFPYFDDLITNITGTGVFTSTSGATPNRILNIEWRARDFGDQSVTGTTNFEVRLFEGQTKFDVIYGQTRNQGASATIGVQRDQGSKFTQYSNDQAVATNHKALTFSLSGTTAVVVRALSASTVRGGIAIRWRTASDIGLLGFNVWRMGSGGELRRSNRALVAAKGRETGSEYRFVDHTARSGLPYTYRVQATRVSGGSSWSGFATARAG
jgi:hypothetical protein